MTKGMKKYIVSAVVGNDTINYEVYAYNEDDAKMKLLNRFDYTIRNSIKIESIISKKK